MGFLGLSEVAHLSLGLMGNFRTHLQTVSAPNLNKNVILVCEVDVSLEFFIFLCSRRSSNDVKLCLEMRQSVL